MSSLKLAFADTKYIPGVDDLQQEAKPLYVQDFEQVLSQCYQTDAHFVCYYPTGTGHGGVFPRLNKAILPKLRHHGADIVTRVFAFDFDNPGHVVWTQDLYDDFWHRLAQCAAMWPMSDAWSLLYTTRAGARLIYVLDEAVPVDIAEGKHRWMVHQFHTCGLPVDKLSDWTRLFRLPFVVRDGKATWDFMEGMHFIRRWHNRIPAADLPSVGTGSSSEYAQIREFREPRPAADDARDLLYTINPETGRRASSEWYKEAKKRLKNRECYGCLFDHAPIAEPGARDTTILQYVGQAVSLLYYFPGTTPQHIYGLFLDPVSQLEPDPQTPDWQAVLWNAVGRMWVREEAKVRQTDITKAQEAETALNVLDQVISGMREWCDRPEILGGQPGAREWASNRLIVSCDGKCFVMSRDGYYDEMQVGMGELIPRIRELGMDLLIEIRQLKENATGWKYADPREVVSKHATVVASVRGVPQIRGGYIEHLGAGDATLVVPCYSRNPSLAPTFDRDVDTWLQMLGGKRYPELNEWIAWALAFEEGPICALSLVGAAGLGKKLIARGFAECLAKPKLATAEDLVGSNQYALLQSPFVVIDEGWPQGISRGRHPADQFRALVGGQSFECNRKYKAPIEVSSPVRMIFTANNLSVVQTLTAGRNLSPEDRHALSVRLKHMDVGDRAAMWLRQKGGLAFTGADGRRWIAGDGGKPSDYVVARHFLWLYANRQRPVPKGHDMGGARFLVEGDASQEIMFEMRTNSGDTPLVIEVVIKLLNLPNQQDGAVIEDGRMFVSISAVLDYYRQHMTQATKEKLSANIIASAFKGLITQEHPSPFVLRTRPHLSKRRWWELDPKLLLEVAQRDGWRCKALEDLADVPMPPPPLAFDARKSVLENMPSLLTA